MLLCVNSFTVGIAMHLCIDHRTFVEALCLKIVLPLLSVHQGNVVQSVGRNWVLRAEDLDLDIERLLEHCQGFIWLPLVVKHVSDAA